MTQQDIAWNRASRRSLAQIKSKKPARKRGSSKFHTIIHEQNIFAPIERFLERLKRTGECEYSEGKPILRDTTETDIWYEAGPAMEGFSEMWNLFAARKGVVIDTSAFREVMDILYSDQPVYVETVDRALASLDVCRTWFRTAKKEVQATALEIEEKAKTMAQPENQN